MTRKGTEAIISNRWKWMSEPGKDYLKRWKKPGCLMRICRFLGFQSISISMNQKTLRMKVAKDMR